MGGAQSRSELHNNENEIFVSRIYDSDGTMINMKPEQPIEDRCMYKWNVEKFNGCEYVPGKCLFSPRFKPNGASGPTWRLQLYPQGYTEEIEDYISIFLQSMSSGFKEIIARFCITVISDKMGIGIRYKSGVKLKSLGTSGWFEFAKKTHLKYDKDMFSPDVTVICEIVFSFSDDTSPVFENYDTYTPYRDNQIDDGELSNDFISLFKSGSHSDVILQAEDKQIKAHKLVLATRSPVFNCMFHSQMQENFTGCVDIADFSFDTLKRFVYFLYSGKTCDLTMQSAMNMFAIAHKYAVDALQSRCALFLERHLDFKNAFDVLVFSDLYDVGNLKEATIDFIAHYFKEVAATEDFENKLKDHPHLGTQILLHISARKMDHEL